MEFINIAIDGPAGAGKSTIAKLLAKKMSVIYVDTGAMYRAVGYYAASNSGLELDFTKEFSDETVAGLFEFIEGHIKEIHIDIKYKNGEQHVFLNGDDVSMLIRTPEMGRMASVVSANKKVRLFGVNLQKEMAKKESVIMDGRDIGTFVLPKAPLKIYLNASAKVRAKRRYDQLVSKGEMPDMALLTKEIEERDARDMARDFAPLKKADDAIEVDTSNMTIDEVVTQLYEMANDVFKL